MLWLKRKLPMYGKNFAFKAPRNEDVKVWRYMSFAKFVSLMEKSALYFARPDKLGDPFEGSLGRPNLIRGDRPRRPPSRISRLFLRYPRSRLATEHSAAERRFNREIAQRSTFINCWHMNSHESAAMWSVYSRSGEGVAVQSTFRKLRDSFSIPRPGYDVFIGTVRYIDYEREGVLEWSGFGPYLHKRKSFQHEQELRAMTHEPVPVGTTLITPDIYPERPGVYIDIDLATLVEAIYVSPKSPDWFKDLVEAVVRQFGGRHGLGVQVPVIRSRLDEGPLY